METCKCKRCGEEWIKRTEKPVLCPRCKNPKWDEEKKEKVKKD